MWSSGHSSRHGLPMENLQEGYELSTGHQMQLDPVRIRTGKSQRRFSQENNHSRITQSQT